MANEWNAEDRRALAYLKVWGGFALVSAVVKVAPSPPGPPLVVGIPLIIVWVASMSATIIWTVRQIRRRKAGGAL